MATNTDRPFFGATTAELSRRVEEAMDWHITLHEIYVELAHREKAAAKELRGQLAQFFSSYRGHFDWPDTDVSTKTGAGQKPDFAYPQGVLGFMGYKVGKSGASDAKRRALLDDAFADVLPSINSPGYMSEWGRPKTSTRLRRIAYSIAEFAKNHKKNDPKKYAVAIRDWESDLEYLRQTYYLGKFSFKWPAGAA